MTGGRTGIFLAAACSNLLSLGLPIVILQVYDRVIPNKSVNTLAFLLLGLVAILVVDALLNLLRSYLSAWRGARMRHFIGCSGLQRMLGGDLKAFESDGPGVHLRRFSGIETISEFYTGQEIHLVIDLPFALLFVGLIAAISPELAAVLLAVIAVLVAGASLSGVYLRRAIENRSRNDDIRYNFVIELLRGIHSLKVLGAESLMERRHERLQATAAEANYWVVFHSGIARVIGGMFSQIVILAIAAYGAALAMDGRLTIGALAACIFLSGRSAQPLLRAMGIWTRFQNIRVAREHLDEIFRIPPDTRGDVADPGQIRGHVVVENLEFAYREDQAPLLAGVGFAARPGEVVGIAGNNGAGKTTLLWLIMGLLRPSAGRALLDGRDVTDYSVETLHDRVIYLPQDGVLFEGTILDNLTMFDATRRAAAERMAGRLQLTDVIGSLPDGYDTRINDNPEEGLPIGVRQRIAIARAFVAVPAPRLIVFDEANSYLDAAGDEAVRRLLLEFHGTATIVLVSHRPSYLALADRTYILRRGELVESAGGARQTLERLEQELSA